MSASQELRVNVIELGECRDLLKDWDVVRQLILKLRVKAGAVCLMDDAGEETIFLFGTYKKDSAAACRAGMHMSWELTVPGDLEPLKNTGSV